MGVLGKGAQQLAVVTSRARRALAESKKRPSPEVIEAYRELLDPSRTTIQQFLESFKIATKKLNTATGTNMVPYRLRDAQLRLLDEVEAMWGAGEAAKILVLKDRQQGISAFVESLMFERFMRGGGGYWRTVSHKDDATDDLIRTFLGFRLQVPEWVFSDVMGAEWVNERPNAMQMRMGAVITRLETLTARDGAMGRGGAPRGMHVSEYPWWTSGKSGLGAALTALEDAPGNFAIIESTGKEFDEFYELCVQARAGKSPYKLVFFDWLSNPTKTFSFPSEAERMDFADTVGQIEDYGRADEAELVARGATLEQMHWRRREIDSPNTPGRDLRHFAREHPLKFEDAFYADNDSIFTPLEYLDDRRDRLADQERTATKGDFEVDPRTGKDLKFVPNKLGRWTIYEMPVPGKAYCYGADASAGLKVLNQGRREGDKAVIDIGNVETGEVVAVFRDNVPPEKLAIEIMCGSKFYGWARGYPERNNDGKVVIRDLPGLMDDWDCPTDVMLAQKKAIATKNGEEFEHHPGFYTDVKSKPVVINHLRRLTRELGPPRDGEPRMLYLGLMDEMRRYVRTVKLDSNGRPSGRVTMHAASGHDDRVMAAALRHEARMWLYDRPDEQTKVGGEDKKTWLSVLSDSIYKRAKGRQDAVDPVLGRGF